MSKRKRRRKKKEESVQREQPITWMAGDGMHTLIPGEAPSEQELEEMTKEYQRQIRNSPIWDELVRVNGEQEAEQVLKRFRVETR